MTTRTLGIRQTAISAAVFGAVLVALMSVDVRVREHFSNLVYGGGGMSSMGDRIGDLAGTLYAAARHQSIENAPLVVFAAVGAVLVVAMLKT
jgi:hypothetical protein